MIMVISVGMKRVERGQCAYHDNRICRRPDIVNGIQARCSLIAKYFVEDGMPTCNSRRVVWNYGVELKSRDSGPLPDRCK